MPNLQLRGALCFVGERTDMSGIADLRRSVPMRQRTLLCRARPSVGQGRAYWNLRGNGGILSTARDMLRWHRALLGDAVLNRRAKSKLFPAVGG